MGMRRRPLARAAVVGGVAYHAGKKGAQNTAAEQSQDQQIADLQDQQAQQQYAPPPRSTHRRRRLRLPPRPAARTWSPSSRT